MVTFFAGWMLLLFPADNSFQIPMATKDACLTALNSPAIYKSSPFLCINTETGEIVRRNPEIKK